MMRPSARLILCALVGTLLAACDTSTNPAAPGADAAPSAPADPAEQAAALIEQMVAAYRDAPVLISTSTMTTVIGSNPRPDSRKTIRFGPGRDIDYETAFFRFVYLDGTILIEYSDVEDRYLRVEGVDDLFGDVPEDLGDVAGRLVETKLRFGRPVDEIVQAFTLGMTGTARVSGFRDITDAEDRRLQQITLITVAGSAAVNIDPKTKFLHSIQTEEKLADAPVPNLAVSRRTVFTTTVPSSPAPITFDPGARFATDSAEVLRGVGGAAALRGLKLAPGEPAPDFALHTMLGERFVLSEQRGRILVLVFWASGDVTSREALRTLGAIVPWAEAHDVEVQLVGVCGMRRQLSEEEHWEKVVDFWEREELPFKTLIDRRDTVFGQWGVLGVPMTVVLDDELRFVNAVGGFVDERTLEAVAKIVEGASETQGTP